MAWELGASDWRLLAVLSLSVSDSKVLGSPGGLRHRTWVICLPVSLQLMGANARLLGFVIPPSQADIPASDQRGQCHQVNHCLWLQEAPAQDPSPATRWCLRSRAWSEPLSLTSLQTSSWRGAKGKTMAPVTAQGPQGTPEHLFQPPLSMEERNWGSGRGRELKVTSRRCRELCESRGPCGAELGGQRVCALSLWGSEGKGVATVSGAGPGQGSAHAMQGETVSGLAPQVLRLGDASDLGRGGWAPWGHARQACRTMLPGISAARPAPLYEGPSPAPSGPKGHLEQGAQLSCAVKAQGRKVLTATMGRCGRVGTSPPGWGVSCLPAVRTPPLLLCGLGEVTNPQAFLPVLAHEMGPPLLGQWCPEEQKSTYHP